MPELPEVETVVRSIAPHVVGCTILHAELYSLRVTRSATLSATAEAVKGAVIQQVRRRGKQIFLDLDHGVIYIHLGMTGKLLWNSVRGKYTRAAFELDRGLLIYDDVRQFGRVEFFDKLPAALQRIGPDALSVPFEPFYAALKQRRIRIKTLLLNQSFLGGIGNIYADEALFAAGIHPCAAATRISQARAKLLHRKIIEVLELAVQHRGSSISDYVDGAGNRGKFQQLHNVYGKAGKPCPLCGTAIKRIVVGQRGTHYCPRCQRA